MMAACRWYYYALILVAEARLPRNASLTGSSRAGALRTKNPYFLKGISQRNIASNQLLSGPGLVPLHGDYDSLDVSG
jgi:hypothetical protein